MFAPNGGFSRYCRRSNQPCPWSRRADLHDPHIVVGIAEPEPADLVPLPEDEPGAEAEPDEDDDAASSGARPARAPAAPHSSVLALQHFSGCSRSTLNGKQPEHGYQIKRSSRDFRSVGPLRDRRLLRSPASTRRIYWYLATYVMPPVARGGHRLPGRPSASASCSTAAGASAATAAREDHRMKVKFLLVQCSGFLLNEAFTWVLTGPLSRADLVAADPGDLRHSARDLSAQPPMGVPLMERVVYRQMAELDQRHWWYRARRDVLADLIRREAMPPAERAASSRSAAAPATISRCSAASAMSTRSSSTTKRARSPEKRLGRQGHERAASGARRRCRPPLRPDRARST